MRALYTKAIVGVAAVLPAFVLPAAADAALIVPKPPTVIVPKATAPSHPTPSGGSGGAGAAPQASPPTAPAVAADPSSSGGSAANGYSGAPSGSGGGQGSGSGSAPSGGPGQSAGGSSDAGSSDESQPSVIGWLSQQLAQAQVNAQINMAITFANSITGIDLPERPLPDFHWPTFPVASDGSSRPCPSFDILDDDEHINDNIRAIGCF
jgi:hypothetical protein